MTISNWLEKVYSAQSTDDLAKIYDNWAQDYDTDSQQRDAQLPTLVSELVAKHVKAENRLILEAGVGTGILGQHLSTLGYDNLIGIDCSAAMLDIARAKNLYSNLYQMTLGEHLNFPDNHFTDVVGAGVFTKGHAPPCAFDELIRVTESGGHIIFSVNNAYYQAVEQKLNDLEQAGQWALVEKTQSHSIMPAINLEYKARIFAYTVQ